MSASESSKPNCGGPVFAGLLRAPSGWGGPLWLACSLWATGAAGQSSEPVGDSRDLARLEAMSLDEILNVKVEVPSALTLMRVPEAPSAVTVITRRFNSTVPE